MVQGLKENWKKKVKIVSKFINGLRVTDKNIINIVEEVLIDFNKDIATSLEKLGTKSASFHTKTDNIIEVEPEKQELGFCRNSQKNKCKLNSGRY